MQKIHDFFAWAKPTHMKKSMDFLHFSWKIIISNWFWMFSSFFNEKCKKIHDFFAWAGLFQAENLFLPDCSPLKLARSCEKIMDFLHFSLKNIEKCKNQWKVMIFHEKCKKSMTFSHELACAKRRTSLSQTVLL